MTAHHRRSRGTLRPRIALCEIFDHGPAVSEQPTDPAPSGAERAFYAKPALAYLRALRPDLAAIAETPAQAIATGRAAGLPLSRFKRAGILPRVAQVLGTLRGLAPQSLLDIGSGRGAFLWPLLEALPELRVLAGELSPHRQAMLAAVHRGGVARLSPLALDVCALPLATKSIDVVTCLEVLEHLRDPARAARELLRVAQRFVIVSVPSRPDDNPEHIQLFARAELEALLATAGAQRTQCSYVHGHLIVVATVSAVSTAAVASGARP